jgi:DNA-binding transcriptional LysR family regulator
LTLGFFPSLVSGRLRNVLEQFRHRSPGILFETMEGSPVDQFEWLRTRRIDAGILAGGFEARDLERLPLWEEQIFAALPQKPAQGHHVFGHLRFLRSQVGASNQTLPKNRR